MSFRPDSVWKQLQLIRQNPLSPRLLQHFGHGQVDGRQAADDVFVAGDGSQKGWTGPVADGEQEEKNPEGERFTPVLFRQNRWGNLQKKATMKSKIFFGTGSRKV